MIRAVFLAVLVAAAGGDPAAPPAAVLVATARGEISVPVSAERGHPALPVAPLAQLLPVTSAARAGWATVEFAGRPFQFLLDAPAMVDGSSVVPLAGGAYFARDSLFLPLQWLTDYVPRRFHEAYRYDPLAARFEEAGLAAVVRAPRPAAAPAPNRYGLRRAHTVTIDPGHGGPDAGTSGRYLPRGVREKDLTLALSRRLRAELERRGVNVVMTRTTDTLIGLYDRAGYCRASCDLFVSVHVNALPRGPGYQRVNGVQTYFLGEAMTAEARRVAALENEAIRYESGAAFSPEDPRLFILKDLQTNEFLRESALLANLVQSATSAAHPGRDRGVSQNRFVVLATASRPAVLVETGFATNRGDARFLASGTGQQRIAEAIAGAVLEYLRRYEDKTAGQDDR